MKVSICQWCGKPVRQTGKRPPSFCSQACRQKAWREPLRAPATQRFERSPLNLAVDAAYAACDGEHVRSKRWVVREFGSISALLWVCRNCKVPIREGLIQAFNRKVAA